MASIDVNTTKGGPVNGHTSWACISKEIQLSDILSSVQLTEDTDLNQIGIDILDRCLPVLLEQVEEGSSCVLTLACAPHCPALITSLLVTSEARTIEVYSLAGDYCGTCRGESQPNTQPDSAERGPFYKKHLILECPTTSCSVKLLSLGGRSNVAVARVVMGLQMLKPTDGCPSLGSSIDMLRVRSMMEEMGTTLSPGAQGLMDMVQMQQKNKADALSGFLPLLMSGGALSALVGGMNRPSSATGDDRHQPSVDHTSSPDEMSCSVPPDPGPESPVGSREPASLADMMTPFLSGLPGGGGGRPCLGPDMLPVLHSVCGQVTRLRIGEAATTSNGPRKEHACCRELEQVMERRLEQMERRLMERMEQRLDTLQQRLETALLRALPLAFPLNHLEATAPMLDQNLSVPEPQCQGLH